jgi:membrane-associated phospholipid phosphatase
MRPTPVPGIALEFLLPIGAALCAASFLFDNAVVAWVDAHRDPGLIAAGWFFTKWGDFLPIVGLLLLVLLVAWLMKRRFVVRLVLLMLSSAVIGGLVANVFRLLSGRTRPLAKVPPGWYGLKDHGAWIVGKFDYSSFPSAHTAVAFSCVVPLWLLLPPRLRWLIAFPATLLAASIGVARMVIDAHHLSDVVTSVWLGIVVGTLVCRRAEFCRPFENRRD